MCNQTSTFRGIYVIVLLTLCACSTHQAPLAATAAAPVALASPDEKPVSILTSPIAPTVLSGTISPTPYSIQPTLSSTPITATITPFPTLSAQEREEWMRLLFKTNGDCGPPCFWRIVPGKTDFNQAKGLMTRLGLELIHTTPSFYGVPYRYKNDFGGEILFEVEDDIVASLSVSMNIDLESPRSEWMAYWPENILRTYGVPSLIRLFRSMQHDGNEPLYIYIDYDLFFDDQDVIISYRSVFIDEIGEDFYHFCPGRAPVPSMRMWYGKEPHYPPSRTTGTSLEEAAALTNEEFYRLITESPETACFDLKVSAFAGQ
ncbi:MAG: hypothetical protein AB1894_01450 [Chloroflexota bacterium]